MNIKRNDVVIIGGGLIGLCTAYFLSKYGLKVSILDKDAITNKEFLKKDFRTTAVSKGSRDIFKSFGIWNKVKIKAEPIKFIKVFNRVNSNMIKFSNPNTNDYLGYIIKNDFLKKVFLHEIINNKDLNIFEKENIKNIEIFDDYALISTQKNIFKTSLIIAADGKNSFVRNFLKQQTFSKKYHQKAFVMNFMHSKNHNNIAYEIFHKSGPLATLPMLKSINNQFQSSLVWSHNSKFINSLYSQNENFLSSIIDEHMQKLLGKVTKIINKQTFPLSAHINTSFSDKRVVYVGDAAHSIHPIAGQGWNLGIRDVNDLSNLIKESISLGINIGSSFVCKKYHQKRFFDAYALYSITDKLNSFFILEGTLPNHIKNYGFDMINRNNFLNRSITNYAMGNRL